MKTVFVLMIIMNGYSQTVAFHEFSTADACNSAVKIAKKNYGVDMAVCIQDTK